MEKREDIPLFKVYMPQGVDRSLADVLYSGYVAEGDQVREFEKLLGEFGKNNRVICTNSCTSALHLVLSSLWSPRKNACVISTPETCVATNTSITSLGARIIWADVSPEDGMMTRETLLKVWNVLPTSIRAEVKAVVYVLWGGDVGDLIGVSGVCKDLGIPLIVDAAQGFGALLDVNFPITKCADVDDYVCCSFQAIKHVTTGDGGCVFVNPNISEEEFKKLQVHKWFGIDRDAFRTPTGEINWKADIPKIGYKFHMNNIAATIGIAQMRDNLENRLQRYKDNALFYDAFFGSQCVFNNRRHTFQRFADSTLSANWVYTAVTSASVDQLMLALKTKGIHASRMHIRNDIYTGFDAITVTELSGVRKFEKEHICIPCGWWVTDEDRQYIAESVIECLEDQK